MRYKRNEIDGFMTYLETFDDAMECLSDEQLGKVYRAEKRYTQALAEGKPFEQPELDGQAQIAFNLAKRNIWYGVQAVREKNFKAKFKKDFLDVLQPEGEKVAPEVIAEKLTDEQLDARGYTPEEIAMIHNMIDIYKAKQEALKGTPPKAPRTPRKPRKDDYDQRPNDLPDMNDDDRIKEQFDRMSKTLGK